MVAAKTGPVTPEEENFEGEGVTRTRKPGPKLTKVENPETKIYSLIVHF